MTIVGKSKKVLKLTFICFLISFCAYGQQDSLKNPKVVVKAYVVQQEFVKKNGVKTDIKELYLAVAEKKYFIKLCESLVSAHVLENFINKEVIAEIEYREGYFDKCEKDSAEVQSRVGEYIVLISFKK